MNDVETLVPISTEIFRVADQQGFGPSHITITNSDVELTLQIDGRSITKKVSDWHKMALEQEKPVSLSQIKDMIIPELKAINQSHTYAPDENTVFVGHGRRFLEFLNGFADFCYGPPNSLATNGKKYFQLMTNGTQDDISTEMLAGLEKKAPPLNERSQYRIEWRVFPEYRKGNSYCRLAFVKNDSPRWFPYCRTAKEAHEALSNLEIGKKYDEICK